MSLRSLLYQTINYLSHMFIERIDAARFKRDLLKNIVIIEKETGGPSYYGVVLERLLHSYENGIGRISSSICAYSVQIMNNHGMFHRPLFVHRAGLPLPEVYVIHDAPGKDTTSSDWARLFELPSFPKRPRALGP